jgi:hypothetical protein
LSLVWPPFASSQLIFDRFSSPATVFPAFGNEPSAVQCDDGFARRRFVAFTSDVGLQGQACAAPRCNAEWSGRRYLALRELAVIHASLNRRPKDVINDIGNCYRQPEILEEGDDLGLCLMSLSDSYRQFGDWNPMRKISDYLDHSASRLAPTARQEAKRFRVVVTSHVALARRGGLTSVHGRPN